MHITFIICSAYICIINRSLRNVRDNKLLRIHVLSTPLSKTVYLCSYLKSIFP